MDNHTEHSEIYGENSLVVDIKDLIQQSRIQLSVTVNAAMSMLYWQIGRRVNDEVLQHHRAEYGKEIVATLASQLKLEFGKGWSEKQLRHCLRFAETFPDEHIVSTLWRQLSWSHIKEMNDGLDSASKLQTSTIG